MYVALLLNGRQRPMLIIASMLIGIALIAKSLIVKQPEGPSAHQYFAVVNGEPIPRQRLMAVSQGLAEQQVNGLAAMEPEAVETLLIDEELLFQRARDLGLLQADAAVRKALVRKAVDRLVLEYGSKPTETELHDYYDAHRQAFREPVRLKVESLRFVDEQQANLAFTALSKHMSLSDGGFSDVGKRFAAHGSFAGTDKALPVSQLRQYLGPKLAAVAEDLAVGVVSEPIASNQAYTLLRVVSKEGGSIPDFEQVRSLVTREYQRRDRERALARAIERLKINSTIRVDLPHDVLDRSTRSLIAGSES